MAEPVAEVYSAFARVFKLGKQAEDALERMTAMARDKAKQPAPNPMQQQAQMEQAKLEAEMQAKQQEHGLKMEQGQQDMAMKQEEHTFKMEELKAKSLADYVGMQRDQQQQEFMQQEGAADRQFKREFEVEKRNSDREMRGIDMQMKREAAGQQANEIRLKNEPAMKEAEVRDGGFDEVKQLIVESAKATQEAIADLQKAIMTPNEIVRDPKTGKVAGSRKVLN
jgi:hypothetical protein